MRRRARHLLRRLFLQVLRGRIFRGWVIYTLSRGKSLTKVAKSNPHLTTGKHLRSQGRIGVGHDIAHSEVAIEFVERGCAKRTVKGRP
jgi:hypothetical protein